LEGVRYFVILHYKATEREDTPFWQHCRDMAVPDTLDERIALFREGAQAFQRGDELFRVDSWVQVLLGQHVGPRQWHLLAQLLPPGQLQTVLAERRRAIVEQVGRLPTHRDLLARHCPEAVTPSVSSV
jgi:tryptophan halogenase